MKQPMISLNVLMVIMMYFTRRDVIKYGICGRQCKTGVGNGTTVVQTEIAPVIRSKSSKYDVTWRRWLIDWRCLPERNIHFRPLCEHLSTPTDDRVCKYIQAVYKTVQGADDIIDPRTR
jgi:hypothetical protein